MENAAARPTLPAPAHSHALPVLRLAMDDLREQVELLEGSANLSTSIADVQKALDLLTAARAKIAAGECVSCGVGGILTGRRAEPKTAPLTLAKLQDPFKKTLETAQKDLKPIYAGLNKYGKALDRVCHSPCSLHLSLLTNPYRNSKTSRSPRPKTTPSRRIPLSSTAR